MECIGGCCSAAAQTAAGAEKAGKAEAAEAAEAAKAAEVAEAVEGAAASCAAREASSWLLRVLRCEARVSSSCSAEATLAISTRRWGGREETLREARQVSEEAE